MPVVVCGGKKNKSKDKLLIIGSISEQDISLVTWSDAVVCASESCGAAGGKRLDDLGSSIGGWPVPDQTCQKTVYVCTLVTPLQIQNCIVV